MDPELAELLVEGEPEDVVAVIVRVADARELPDTVEVVASFGEVVTGRIQRGEVLAARAHPGVASMKAAEILVPELPIEWDEEQDAETDPPASHADDRRPADEPATGRGVVVGVVDWG